MPWAELEIAPLVDARRADLSLEEINRMFYDSYPRSYFEGSMLLCLSGYQDPSGSLSVLTETSLLREEGREGALQFQVDIDDENKEAVRQASRLQIVGLYYHALETFLRLFLAHAPDVESPWLQLNRDKGSVFHKKLRELERWSTEWTSRDSPEDAHVWLSFFPADPLEAKPKGQLGNAKSWLRFAARECLDARVHNSWKHGLSMRSGQPHLAFFSGVDPRTDPDAKPLIEWTGEALIHLSRRRRQDGSADWMLEHRKLYVTDCIGITFMVQKWIRTILDMGEVRFLYREPRDQAFLPWASYEEYVEKTNTESQSAMTLTGFAMPTGWLDKAPRKKGGRLD